jgi:hypothetical protein
MALITLLMRSRYSWSNTETGERFSESGAWQILRVGGVHRSNTASAPWGFRPQGYVWNAWAKWYGHRLLGSALIECGCREMCATSEKEDSCAWVSTARPIARLGLPREILRNVTLRIDVSTGHCSAKTRPAHG